MEPFKHSARPTLGTRILICNGGVSTLADEMRLPGMRSQPHSVGFWLS
jgi:hypothetical protein